MIGRQVSHYRVLEKIGSGGMGDVYLARDEKLRRNVALKFLPEHLTRDQDRKDRFVREARAAAAIEHPHVGAIYDIDEVDGQTFIAMEYIRGTTLREAIQARRLSLRDTFELAIQIASGLRKAHECGVVHRDLKPENVALSEDGYVKVIDFGIAKLLEPSSPAGVLSSAHEAPTWLKTEEGLVLGTVGYMSPEQARGQTVDERSDIFSFGAVLYEMASGQAAFRRQTVLDSLNAVVGEEPPPFRIDGAEAPPGLQKLLAKCLAKNPSDRYQSLKEVVEILQRLREDIAAGSAVSRPDRSFRSVRGLWVAVSLTAAATLSWYFLGRDTSQVGIGATGRPAIAVMTFRDHTGDVSLRWLSQGLPDMILTGLAQTPGLDVISAQRIQELAREPGGDGLEGSDDHLLARVARRSGAGAMVVGSVYKAGDEIRIDVQLADVHQGTVLAAESVRGVDVFPLVDELTSRIRMRLEVSDRPAGKPIRDITTPSLEAYRLYREGLNARHNIRHVDAIAYFEQAVAIDPSFANAHFQLWQSNATIGEAERAETYRLRVLENLDRLPERERVLVEARNAWNPGRDPQRAVELLEGLLARYPDEEEAYDLLVHIYSRDASSLGKMLAHMERWARAFPPPGSTHHLNHFGYALLGEGRYTEAIRKFEDYARIAPNEANPYDSLGEVYLVSGNPAKAIENYGKALEIDPSFAVSHVGRAFAFAMLGRYDESLVEVTMLQRQSERATIGISNVHGLKAGILSRLGRFREAASEAKNAEAAAVARGSADGRVEALLLRAWIALDEGNHTAALAGAEQALALIPEMTSPVFVENSVMFGNLLAGVAEIRAGNAQTARSRLEAMEDAYNDDAHKFWRHALAGEIALSTGEVSRAESEFEKGEPQTKMGFNTANPIQSLFANSLMLRDGRARAKKEQGEVEEALVLYRELNTPDLSSKWVSIFEPRYLIEQARLLDGLGDEPAAVTEYERFLDLWSEADPRLPEVQEARTYLSRR